MLTVADMGEGGVKNHQKSADVLYGRSLGESRTSQKIPIRKVDVISDHQNDLILLLFLCRYEIC